MISYLPDKNSIIEDYRIFSDVDCIVSDIDGTLTKGFNPIFDQIRKKTAYLKEREVITTIATGRPYRGAYNVIQQLGIEAGTPLVLYNGGILLENDTGHIIKEFCIPFEEVQIIVNIVSQCGAGIYVYTYNGQISDGYSYFCVNGLEEEVYYGGKIKRKTDINGNHVKTLVLENIKEKKIASILLEKKDITKELWNQIKEYLKSDSKVSYTDSGSGFIEICAIQNKKSIVIDELRKRNIRKCMKKGKILAIGDNDNDIDLFKTADISVAVANASVQARKTADYLCRRECAKGYLDMLMVIENAKKRWR